MTEFETGATADSADSILYARVTRRIMPLLFLSYVVSYLDRVNVGFAKLQMMSDLKFSDTVYGFGAGIFFIGYFLFEIPSNMLMHQVGARRWIARIMISWSIVSAAMMAVNSVTSFYLLRFLLGLAEAGFFPGLILYMTYWYPADRRGRIYALLMTAVAVSGIFGGPLSGWLLRAMPGIGGLAGWQWLFLIEALPAALLGVAVLVYLPDRIHDAHWLSKAEQQRLNTRIEQEDRHKLQLTLAQVFSSIRLWHLALIYFSLVVGLYGVSFWLPTIIKTTGVTDTFEIGLLSALPYLAAAIVMMVNGRLADRHSDRRRYLFVPALLACIGLLISTVASHDTALAMVCLTVATAGILSGLSAFWSLPTALLSGGAAAAGIALINSFGNLAGFASPYLVGLLRDITHSTDSGMYMIAAFLLLAATLTLMVPTYNRDNRLPIPEQEQTR